jgi:uncharacterized membrane protein YkoI
MRALKRWFSVSAVAGLVLLAAVAGRAADDKNKAEKIAPDKLPKAVMDRIKARLPGAEITSAEKETEDGKVVYDIELKHEGRKYEMDILADGTLIEIEKEVALKDVPAAVTKALKAKYPDATVKEVMEVNKVKGKTETPDHYEVTLTVGGKEREVVVSLDGKSVKTEAEEKKEKEKK